MLMLSLIRPAPWLDSDHLVRAPPAPAVTGRVDHPEQLGVDVLVLLPGVGVGGIHARRHPVRDHLAVGAVPGPVRDRVGSSLPITPSNEATSPGRYSRPSRLSKVRFSNITDTT
jgi:hypothetical protein